MKIILSHYGRPDLLWRQVPFVRKYLGDDIEVVISGPLQNGSCATAARGLGLPCFQLFDGPNAGPRQNWYEGLDSAIQRHGPEHDLILLEADVIPLKEFPGFGDRAWWATCYDAGISPSAMMVRRGYSLRVDHDFHYTQFKNPDLGRWSMRRQRDEMSFEWVEDFALHLDRSEKQVPPNETARKRIRFLDELAIEHGIKKRPVNSRGIGTILKERFIERYGEANCRACAVEVSRLNTMTPYEVLLQADDILDDIIKRAKRGNGKTWQMILAVVMPTMVKHQLRMDLLFAVNEFKLLAENPKEEREAVG